MIKYRAKTMFNAYLHCSDQSTASTANCHRGQWIRSSLSLSLALTVTVIAISRGVRVTRRPTSRCLVLETLSSLRYTATNWPFFRLVGSASAAPSGSAKSDPVIRPAASDPDNRAGAAAWFRPAATAARYLSSQACVCG